MLKASSYPHGMILNLSLNLDDQGRADKKKGNQEKIRNRKKNSTHQGN